jgi:hypothetical protein
MTPCQGHALLFDDPAAIDTARGICKRQCAQLIECRAWALRTEVAGVCGGLTEQERALWRRDFAGGPAVPLKPRWEPLDHDVQVAITAARRAGFREADIARALGLNVRALPRRVAA